MTPELNILALAGLLQAVQFVLMAVPANVELGPKRTMSPRDKDRIEDALSPTTARLNRALNNHYEALALFTIAVVVVTLGDQSNAFTAACAYVYLIARVLDVLAYALGLVPWRSYIWFTGFMATVAMLISALF
jgi:uncharacterized MAPEG superfamily protein